MSGKRAFKQGKRKTHAGKSQNFRRESEGKSRF